MSSDFTNTIEFLPFLVFETLTATWLIGFALVDIEVLSFHPPSPKMLTISSPTGDLSCVYGAKLVELATPAFLI